MANELYAWLVESTLAASAAITILASHRLPSSANVGQAIALAMLSGTGTLFTSNRQAVAAIVAATTPNSGPGMNRSRRGTNEVQATMTRIVRAPIPAAG